jgi:hypothetical protein
MPEYRSVSLRPQVFAPDQTGQQRVTMLGRAVMPTGGNVAADHGADRLEPLPAHIPVVGVGLQRQPFVPGLAVFTLTPPALYPAATAVLP